MSLIVTKEIEGQSVVLSLKGTLDIATANLQLPFLDDINGARVLILNLSGIDFMDSTGIGLILQVIHLSQDHKLILKISGINELTHHVFEMVGLYEILESVQGELL